MFKNFLILILIALIFPKSILGQTPSQIATVSPQLRNRLQLLNNPKVAQNHFRRFERRLKALMLRQKKINTRIESRLGKISASQNIIDRIKRELILINTNINAVEKELASLIESWNNLVKNNDNTKFPAFKKRMSSLFSMIDSVITDQKNILKEIKKYKAQSNPREKVASESTLNN